jgi:hypothetical protein
VAAVLSACSAKAGPVTQAPPLSAAHLHLSDFQALDASFVSDDRGFVLGRAKCSGTPCVVLLGTSDGARHWTPLSKLPVAPYDDSGSCRVDSRCAGHVRFATPLVGYAFGPAMFMTTDGGRTWTREPGWTTSLEATSDSVLRISPTSDGCNGQPTKLDGSTPGSKTWTVLRSLSAQRNCPPTLYRQGPSALAVIDYGNPQGSVPYAEVETSTDGGRQLSSSGTRRDESGRPYDDICYRDTGHTASVALAPGGVLAQLCVGNGATSRQYDSWLRVSTDLGRTYEPPQPFHRADPSYPVPYVVAAASATHLLALSDGPHVGVLQVTFDGGRHWKMTGEMPPGIRTLVGFEDDNTARAIVGDEVFTTVDGGRTWRDDTMIAES